MKKQLLSILAIAIFVACSDKEKSPHILVDWFEYSGQDPVFDAYQTSPDQYQNPLLAGFYPDPSVCRVDSDYYLVNSTFSYFPGIPVFHSRDLVHWKQLGHVLDRPSQLNLDSLELSWGVFAPAISYHKGKFYVINTIVFGGGNFYVTADNPAGPWSEPVWLPEVDGIDPSFFFDDDGKAYIVHNGPAPVKEHYPGHRAIWLQEFSIDSGKVIGQRKVLVDKGVDKSTNPQWIEGPHIYKKDGYYYLIAAEGGTATWHSEVVFRSRSVWGPYVPGPKNPVLTQRYLDDSRPYPITSTGHADMIETQNGEWWVLFLGCRPYEGDLYNTGRETFMMPVTWRDGWPWITDTVIPYAVEKPNLADNSTEHDILTGNFTWRDDFNDTTLGMKWNMIRTPRQKWYSLTDNPGQLKIDLRQESIRDLVNPSFLGRRQQHGWFTAVTAFAPVSFDTGCNAGLIAFQNEKHYIYMGIRKGTDGYKVFLERSGSDENNGQPTELIEKDLKKSTPDLVFLKIEGKGSVYDFYYSLNGKKWDLLQSDVNAKNLSTNIAGGFVGAYLGVYGNRR